MKNAFSLTLILAGFLLVPHETTSQDRRLPAPNPGTQKEAEGLIRGIFKKEYSQTSPTSRKALASKLHTQAGECDDLPGFQFVLYREAKEMALLAGEPQLAQEIIREWAARFEVDALTMNLDVLKNAGRKAKAAAEKKEIAEAYLGLADEATKMGDFKVAEKALSAAKSMAYLSRDIPLVTSVKEKREEVEALKKEFAELEKARKTLESSPEDPSANTSWGEHLCREGDWEKGLPHLAKGVDGPLKEAARKDLAAPTEPQDQVAAGDAWWDLSEKEEGKAKENLMERAAHWYAKAEPSLHGLLKIKIAKRLEEARTKGLETKAKPATKNVSIPGAIDLIKLIKLERDTVKGSWKMQGGALVSSPDTSHNLLIIPYAPPPEYDLLVDVHVISGRGIGFGLVFGDRQCVLQVDSLRGATGIGMLDGRAFWNNDSTVEGEIFKEGQSASLAISVRKNQILLKVNGKTIMDWKGESRQLGLHPGYRVPNTNVLLLNLLGSSSFSKFLLVPVTGQGKAVR